MKTIRAAAFFGFLALIAFVCLVKPAQLVRVVFDNVFFAPPGELQPELAKRLVFVPILSGIWFGILSFLDRALSARRIGHGVSWFLGNIGLGAFVLLSCYAFRIPCGPVASSVLLFAPLLISSFWAMRLPRAIELAEPQRAKVDLPRWPVWGVAILFAFVLVNEFAYLIVFKPQASGDEAHFWWSASSALQSLGFTRYMSEFEVSTYVPGYPILSSAFVPFGVGSGDFALPMLSFLLLWMTLSSFSRRIPETRARFVLTAGALITLCFSDSWIRTIFMRSWYAEMMAVVLILNLGLFLSDSESRSGWTAILAGFGLGFFARVSKAPLAVTILPLTLVLYVVPAVFSRAFRKEIPRARALAVFAGALTAHVLWGKCVSASGKLDRYYFDFKTLLQPEFTSFMHDLVPYNLTYYKKQIWVPFALAIAGAFSTEPKKHAPMLLFCLGMLCAVALLYVTFWKGGDYESSMRYFLHGTHAFFWFVFLRTLPDVARALAKLASKSGR